LANTSADPAGTSRFNRNMGVSPTSWVMSSATRRRDISEVFEGTLQGTGRQETRQLPTAWQNGFDSTEVIQPFLVSSKC
jgi:hypothetical protein